MTTMTTKARFLVGLAVIAGILAIGVGVAAAGGGDHAQGSSTSGGMMGGSSTATGMMGGSSDGMMGSGSTVDGMMGSGMGQMMSGVNMDAMHEQMMAALTAKVPADQLAQCDALHDQMWSDGGTDAAQGSDHSAHHGNAGSTG
jgi:hypothetical protein